MPHLALILIDTLLRDLMNTNKPFGGKVLVLGGDFRYIPPVVKKGNRVHVVQAYLKMAVLWPHFITLKFMLFMISPHHLTQDDMVFVFGSMSSVM